jgi:hypothetical protein
MHMEQHHELRLAAGDRRLLHFDVCRKRHDLTNPHHTSHFRTGLHLETGAHGVFHWNVLDISFSSYARFGYYNH